MLRHRHLGVGLLANVRVLRRVRSLAEDRPEVVDGVAPRDAQRAFLLQPPRRRVHLQVEGELRLADFVHPPRNVGVFAVERDRRIEPADLLQRRAPQHEVAALNHRSRAQNVAVQRVHQVRNQIEYLHAEALAGRIS